MFGTWKISLSLIISKKWHYLNTSEMSTSKMNFKWFTIKAMYNQSSSYLLLCIKLPQNLIA